MKWLAFEEKIADIFKMFGYSIKQDILLDGRQTDVFAYSSNIFKTTILIECKFHDVAKNKVGVEDVEAFKYRVANLRNAGKIDKGFLVTNTAFSKLAKQCVDGISYVHLFTSGSLMEELLDAEGYLKNFIANYEKVGKQTKYVDLWLLDSAVNNEIKFDVSLYPDEYLRNYYHLIEDEDNLNLTEDYTFDDEIIKDDIIEDDIIEDDTLEDDILDDEIIEDDIVEDDYRAKAYEEAGDSFKKIIKVGESLFSTFIKRTMRFLESKNRLQIVLADFGGGKSTCLNHLMYILCKRRVRKNKSFSPIPLLINLKEFNKAPDFDSLYTNFFKNEFINSNISLPVFKMLNENGYFTLIFDGFDEMGKHINKAERKHAFVEICKQMTAKNKIVLSGRPGYFPDTKEMVEIIEKHIFPSKKGDYFLWGMTGLKIPRQCKITCLQLMDDTQLLEYFEKSLGAMTENIQDILAIENIKDLARRPVLTNMIMDSLEDLEHIGSSSINLFKLYQIYTNKWINREEDKGRFRLLIDSEKKILFLHILSLQMFKKNVLEIHYHELNDAIKIYFSIDKAEDLDYFSHDIRTCSFLKRDDEGNYKFIHKSFMEYFIASEFMMFKKVNKGIIKFNDFTNDIIQFMDLGSYCPTGFKTLWSQYSKASSLSIKISKQLRILENSRITNKDSLVDICIVHNEEVAKLLYEITQSIDNQYPEYLAIPKYNHAITSLEERVMKLEDEIKMTSNQMR